jgi:DNA polymerase I
MTFKNDIRFDDFREITAYDFEFVARGGNRPEPVCMVAKELRSKSHMRDLVMTGGPWSADDRAAITGYCLEDVISLERLLQQMQDGIDLPRALLRGRYMTAAARVEWIGVPIDVPMLELLREHWDDIQDSLIERTNAAYRVFKGRSFNLAAFADYLKRHGIAWRHTPTGRLDLTDEYFRQQAKAHPVLMPLQQLRSTLSKMRLNDVQVGADGRNRALLSAYRSRTGRNQPSNVKFIFGPHVWMRRLIKPPPGWAVAYLDWSAQEPGIMAVLSGDPLMLDAYRSGDVYLSFGKQAGLIPPDATKETHKADRDRFKPVVLGTAYGLAEHSLADRLGIFGFEARELLQCHRDTYPRFWEWSDAQVDQTILTGRNTTMFGWRVHAVASAKPNMFRNWPVQSAGGEMLRIACILGFERGVDICAPVHDAVLIQAPSDQIDHAVSEMRAAMAEASRLVLDGFELRTNAHVYRYPETYRDPDGRDVELWNSITELLRPFRERRRA